MLNRRDGILIYIVKMRMKTDHKGIAKLRLPLKSRTTSHDGSKTDAIGPSVETNLRMHMTPDHVEAKQLALARVLKQLKHCSGK